MKNKLIKGMFLFTAGLVPVAGNASNNKNNEISKKTVSLLINRFEKKDLKVEKALLLKLKSIKEILDEDQEMNSFTQKETETTNTPLFRKKKTVDVYEIFYTLLDTFFDKKGSNWEAKDCLNVFINLLSFLDKKTDTLSEQGKKQIEKYLTNYSTDKLKLLFNLLNYFGTPHDLTKFIEKLVIDKLSTKFFKQKSFTFEKDATNNDIQIEEPFFSEINFGEKNFLQDEFKIPLNSWCMSNSKKTIVFSPDGKMVATNEGTITTGSTIIVYDVFGKKICKHSWENANKVFQAFSFSPDSKHFIAFSWHEGEHTLIFYVHDIETGKDKEFKMDLPQGTNGFFNSPADNLFFLNDGSIAVLTHNQQNSTFHFLSLETGKIIKEIAHPGWIFDHDVFLNKSRTVMILKLKGNEFKTLDLKNWQMSEVFTPWKDSHCCTIYSNNGSFVLKINQGFFELWKNNEDNKQIEFSMAPPRDCRMIFFSPDEQYIVFSNSNSKQNFTVFYTGPDAATNENVKNENCAENTFESKSSKIENFKSKKLEPGTLVFKAPLNHTARGFTLNGRFFVTQTKETAFVWDTKTIDKTTGTWKLIREIKINSKLFPKIFFGPECIGIHEGDDNKEVKIISFETVNFTSTAERLAFKILKDAEKEHKTLKISVLSQLGQCIGQLPDNVLKYFIKKGILVLVPEEKTFENQDKNRSIEK